jgi:hypothetical protein
MILTLTESRFTGPVHVHVLSVRSTDPVVAAFAVGLAVR